MDGHQQREVISALERALRAGGACDPAGLRTGASVVRRLNQLPVYDGVPDLLEQIAVSIEAYDAPAALCAAQQLRAVLGDSPIAPLVDKIVATLGLPDGRA
ncbi:MAG: hypothetical protein MP439_02225 [Ferrimicrobium sp.]|nr:hypothetical protein [Ferrimicrobium sp.]